MRPKVLAGRLDPPAETAPFGQQGFVGDLDGRASGGGVVIEGQQAAGPERVDHRVQRLQVDLERGELRSEHPPSRVVGSLFEMKGGTTFFFVTKGIESALEQAKKAAAGTDVVIGGGASVVQQYLAAGLVDEFELHIVPILLGAGERLLENVGDLKLEQLRAIEAPGVTHLKYRVANAHE